MQMTSEQALFMLHTALPTLEREHQLTKKVLDAVPADKADYRPDPNSMSASDLVWHIASAEDRFLAGVAEGQFNFGGLTRPATTTEMCRWYSETFEKNLTHLKALTGDQAAKIIDFRGVFQLPAVAFVTFSMHHVIHHRGQLSVYLRPMGAKVPSIYGESYDAVQARKAMEAVPA